MKQTRPTAVGSGDWLGIKDLKSKFMGKKEKAIIGISAAGLLMWIIGNGAILHGHLDDKWLILAECGVPLIIGPMVWMKIQSWKS